MKKPKLLLAVLALGIYHYVENYLHAGNPTWPFTKALQKQVSHVQKHSDSVQSVCRLLDVRMED